MILSVKELSKTYGTKKAVDSISFELEKPGVFGLIGTNGAGKTTTIRMMLGIIEKDFGTARWNGKSISRETMSFGYMRKSGESIPRQRSWINWSTSRNCAV